MLKTIETLHDSITIKEEPYKPGDLKWVIGELKVSNATRIGPEESAIDLEKAIKYRIIGHLYREVEERLLEIRDNHVQGMTQRLWSDICSLISDLRVK